METDKHRPQSKKQRPYSAYAKYSGIAIQMCITIYVGHYVGELLDEKYNNTEEFYTKTVTMIAVFIAILVVILQAMQLTNSDDKKN